MERGYSWVEDEAYEEGLRSAARARGLRRAQVDSEHEQGSGGEEKGRSSNLVRGQYPAAAAPAGGGPFAARAALEDLQERCAEEWGRSSALRSEFPSLAAYIAFTKAEATGRVKIMNQGPVVKL